ncbi:hypothetical protein M4951_14885 [Blastopirellula sp. J2-11]|uniref:hypothetical protein n=1 Tax=Blastopirellula sp. J2-11 TaxID=2943192 RepID=UPI0021C92553|nr:hypothetical protein [Blastopirellula sp. J2-11]UUO04673.1 hypothetical protein M4951_14885 [Blastopirellula sp. J2-11]
MFQRILSTLFLLAGALGTIGCVLILIAVWTVSMRVTRATDKVFNAADGILADVRERVAKTEDRVQALKITSHEIQANAQTWAKAEAAELAGSRLGVKKKAELLLTELDHAKQWIALTESSVQLLQQAVEASQSLGVSAKTDSVQNLIQEIEAIQEQLRQGIETAKNITHRAAEAGEGKLTADRSDQIAQLVVRVVATLGIVDARIQAIENHLANFESALKDAQQKLIRWVNLAAIGATAIFAWMAAGQCALCYLGIRGFRRRSNLAVSSPS